MTTAALEPPPPCDTRREAPCVAAHADEAVHGAPSPRPARHFLAAALVALVFAGSLALNLRHNDFPLDYHEDESTKAVQVASDTRNFHHPQLLLEATQWAWRALGRPADLHRTVVIGRGVSAVFASLAAVAVALTCYRLGGLPGLCLGGAAAGTCPALLVHAHYMKEDAALAFGVCAVVLASHGFWEHRANRALWPTLLLSAACGFAASAKFAGAFALAACLPLVALAGRPTWRTGAARTVLLLAGFVATVAAINHRVFEDPRRAASRLSDEHRHATTRHVGFTMARPNAFHAAAFVRQTMPHALVASAAFGLWAVVRPGRAGRWAVWLIAFTAGYLLMVSWSVLPYYRYALPVVVMGYVIMALALLRLCEILPLHARGVATLCAGGVIVGLQLPRCLDAARQFGDDSRDRLRLWAMHNLPADTVVVQDARIGLDEGFDPRLGVRGRPSVLVYGSDASGSSVAAGAGALPDLYRKGVEYVAVSDFSYYRYLDPSIRPVPSAKEVYGARRRWYLELFRDHELVWSSVPKHPTHGHFNNPELRLYRLRPPGGEGGTR